mgnify:CR=1 FL=1
MKILSIRAGIDGCPSISPGADSAILRVGEPVFIQQPAQEWATCVTVAVRVSRLGLHIPVAHASRHYDAVAAIHMLAPVRQSPDCLPPLFRDRAVAPGEWVPVEQTGNEFTLNVTRRPLRGDESVSLDGEIAVSLDRLRIDEIVSYLSQTMTLKNGDMIILRDASVELGAPVPNTVVSAYVSGFSSLSVRIK